MVFPSPLPPVLIADNRAGDLRPLIQQLEKLGVKNPLVLFRAGEELRNSLSPFSVPLLPRSAVSPCVLFLALDLPGGGGFEPLLWIRQQAQLKDLPTIIIADSFEPQEVQRAAALGVARFVARSSPPQIFADIITSFCRGGTRH